MPDEPIHWNRGDEDVAGRPYVVCGLRLTPKATFKRTTDEGAVTCLDCLTHDVETELASGKESRAAAEAIERAISRPPMFSRMLKVEKLDDE